MLEEACLVESSFSWDRFDDGAVEARTGGCGYEGTDEIGSRRQWLSEHWKVPTNEFATQAGFAIENVWLRRQPDVAKSIVNVVATGERDPQAVMERALNALGVRRSAA